MNNNNINLKPTEKMGYINFWCQKVIPLVFDDSLSYYEAICKFMQKLNEVINALNNNAECIDELRDKYIILQRNFDALEVKWEEFKTYIENEFNTFKTEITTREENFETRINNKQTEFETKINGDIINLTNNINNFKETMTGEFNAFKTYVENYLNNIDVQRYVNIKINELAESGYFSTLLTNLGFNPDNYLAKNNTTVYVPTTDYNPATKKYVDEHSSQGVVYSAGNGIKIENNTISTNNYNSENIGRDALHIKGYINAGTNNKNNDGGLSSNLNIIGDGNKSYKFSTGFIIGKNNNCQTGYTSEEKRCIGNNNSIGGINFVIGDNISTGTSKEFLIIGKYNDKAENEKSIVIANGIDNNNKHNAIVIPEGTSTPISINQEVNCSNNFITRTFVEGDNVDTIYAEKPNALVNASEVRASIKPINDRLDNVTDTYTEYNLTLLNNFTGSAKLINKNGILYLDINVIYPTNTTSDKEQDIDIFKITQITASNYNGFKNDIGILVNKSDTSAREETRCIRTTIINDNEISVSYIAKDLTQTAPKGYTFTYFGAIGVEKHS